MNILTEMSQQNVFDCFLILLRSSKAAGKSISMFEDCLFEDKEEADPYHTYYRIQPDHEILINTVTIYLKFSDAAHVRLNQ